VSRDAQVVMIGSALDAPGGITAVLQAYRDSGLFERWRVAYVTSYRRPGAMSQLRTVPPALWRLLALLLAKRVRLVHVHSAARGSFYRKSLFCALAWLFDVPFVFHLHSGEFRIFYEHECPSPMRRWVRWVLRHAARVVVLTPDWMAALSTIEERAALHVLVNPVHIAPLPARRPLRAGHPVLLFLGRLREKKGVFDLLRAMPTVLERHSGTRLVLAGDGDARAVHTLAAELGVTACLDLPGWIDGADKDAALARADVLVLPSHFEGLPICVLEAMATGVPVVATAAGGIPYALDGGRCGVLVATADSAALAAALVALLDDAPRRAALAHAAHRRALDLFSVNSVVGDLEALWGEILGPAGAARTVAGATRSGGSE
jgi:glycosyltransferase involved in cell wall biosynthesis